MRNRDRYNVKIVPSENIRMAVVLCWMRSNSGCLTQEEAAKKAGVAQSAVSRWETGTSVPRLFELMQYVSALGFTLARFEQEYLKSAGNMQK